MQWDKVAFVLVQKVMKIEFSHLFLLPHNGVSLSPQSPCLEAGSLLSIWC